MELSDLSNLMIMYGIMTANWAEVDFFKHRVNEVIVKRGEGGDNAILDAEKRFVGDFGRMNSKAIVRRVNDPKQLWQ